MKPTEISDKELINHLLKKVDNLEKQIIVLNKEVEKVDDLEKQINALKKEISKVNDLENQISILNKEIEKLKQEKNEEFELDSTITNSNEIKFIIDYLKETENFKNKNFKLNLLYRGTRDGDRTADVHKKCDGLKNIIVFMKTEQGNSYGMYSEIGWETRTIKYEYPKDNNAFLFSLNKKKIHKAIKGKVSICWVGNNVGLYIFNNIGFKDYFLNRINQNLTYVIKDDFENCKMEDFNSGLKEFKFLEIEIYQIK